jgi:hypothetical protein
VPLRVRSQTTGARVGGAASGVRRGVFVFFSNRLGCLGSLLVSVVLTAVVVLVLMAL